MLTEIQKNVLPTRIVQRLEQLNDEVLNMLGCRIKEIGELLPSDAHRLQQLRECGSDINRITYKLAEITELNTRDIYDIYDILANDNSEFSKQFYEVSGKDYIPYEENVSLKEFVRSMASQTAGEYVNMSRSIGFMIYDKDGNKVFTNLSKAYQDVIDDAVTAVSLGVTDFHSSMRRSIKQLADSGLRTKYNEGKDSAGKVVDYASGYSRRLDTSVRQNILWGVKQAAVSMQERLGEEFGADGYEIDYHSNPRPSHAEMGGQQYVIGPARTINGKHYDSFDSVADLLEDYGCLHFKWAIICGVSEPNYTVKELAQLKAKDRETFEYEGKRYTGYEATQVQRKLEAKIRNAKDRHTIATASGDDTMRRTEQEKIDTLLKHYKKFSDAAGLPYKADRLTVEGYKKALTRVGNGDIINHYKGKGISISENKNISSDTEKRIRNATRKVTSDFKILERCSEPIRFGEVVNGLAENNYKPKIGKNQIVLDEASFADEKSLIKKLRDDYISGKSYETDKTESLVAHEMGHNAHIALALKRANISYGKPLNNIELVIFNDEFNKISQEIYEAAFDKENFIKIQNDCVSQLGNMVYSNPHELIAQSFGNYYYGKEKSSIAKKIVKYFIKELK